MDFEAKASDLWYYQLPPEEHNAEGIRVLAQALKEAYDQGAKSEAAMWEMQKVGQEMDLE